jgi:sugar diacid utilization regulator
MRDETEKMQTIGVIGIAGQDTAIKPFCLLEAAGLMVTCRFGQERVSSEVHNRRRRSRPRLLCGRAAFFAVHNRT